jgi:hypothetical protein
MSLHFQVFAQFKLNHGKPQLLETSISSTTAAVTQWAFNPSLVSSIAISRIFGTLQEAKSYIAYLRGVYKQTTAPPPILDSGQKELFL